MSFISRDKDKKEDKSMSGAKPITQQEGFCAELVNGKMDFTALIKDKDGNDHKYIVAVSTGSRNKPLLLASTMRGPYDFYEMVEQVGCMWEREQHHAKVYQLTTDINAASTFLDEGTIDYIEAYWEDIISEGILEATIFDEDLPIIPAGLIEASAEDDE
jgi:hypothetical protein